MGVVGAYTAPTYIEEGGRGVDRWNSRTLRRTKNPSSSSSQLLGWLGALETEILIRTLSLARMLYKKKKKKEKMISQEIVSSFPFHLFRANIECLPSFPPPLPQKSFGSAFLPFFHVNHPLHFPAHMCQGRKFALKYAFIQALGVYRVLCVSFPSFRLRRRA